MNELHKNQPQQLWQSQPVEGIQMSADAIRSRVRKFESTIQWRNGREYLVALLVAIFFGFRLVRTHDFLFRVAFGLLIAGLVYMVFQIHRHGSVKSSPASMGSSTCAQFFRSELERQRDLLANVWPWYLAPLVPGFALYTAAFAMAVPYPANLAGSTLVVVTITPLFFFLWKVNQRAARSLQRQIDQLSAAESQPR